MAFTHRRVSDASVRAALNEQVLDHRAGREQIQARDNNSGSADTPWRIASARVSRACPSARAVGLEQRNQIAHQQRRVHGIRVARDGEHLGIVRRTIGFQRAMPELRSQVGRPRAGRRALWISRRRALVNDAEIRSAI
jgi:hypothetical protein